MGGFWVLLIMSLVMSTFSFFAGYFPIYLQRSSSSSKMRLLSSAGVGILMGTSLIVIIPEGIDTIADATLSSHSHGTRQLHAARYLGASRSAPKVARYSTEAHAPIFAWESKETENTFPGSLPVHVSRAAEEEDTATASRPGDGHENEGQDEHGPELPTLPIGMALVGGFVLMFLIDRVPATLASNRQADHNLRHVSLRDLRPSDDGGEEETESFLDSPGPAQAQPRSYATTIGLVIHACADGIAMGASATTDDMELGIIIFVAIMFHKAPAAFGLTAVLLKQGLTKRMARMHLIVFSLAAPAGAFITYALVSLLGGGNMEGPGGRWWTGILLLFSAGTFLFVAMHAMQEDSSNSSGHGHHADGHGVANKKHPRLRWSDTFATVGGLLGPLLLQLFPHHH